MKESLFFFFFKKKSAISDRLGRNAAQRRNNSGTRTCGKKIKHYEYKHVSNRLSLSFQALVSEIDEIVAGLTFTAGAGGVATKSAHGVGHKD